MCSRSAGGRHSVKGFMNITVLTYLEQEASKDYDPVVKQVAAVMRKNGHKVSVLGVNSDLKKLTAGLRRLKPDLVFNLMEMFGEDVTGDVAVAGLLDSDEPALYRIPGRGNSTLLKTRLWPKKSWPSRG